MGTWGLNNQLPRENWQLRHALDTAVVSWNWRYIRGLRENQTLKRTVDTPANIGYLGLNNWLLRENRQSRHALDTAVISWNWWYIRGLHENQTLKRTVDTPAGYI